MALPLKKTDPILPENLGPKIVPMPVYNLDPTDLEESAAEEVDFVLRRVSEAPKPSLHEIGERVTEAVDQTVQKVAASSVRGFDALSELAKQDPLRFIATIAAAAFVVGFGLRLWRSSRA
jgi:hypothetical protein